MTKLSADVLAVPERDGVRFQTPMGERLAAMNRLGRVWCLRSGSRDFLESPEAIGVDSRILRLAAGWSRLEVEDRETGRTFQIARREFERYAFETVREGDPEGGCLLCVCVERWSATEALQPAFSM